MLSVISSILSDNYDLKVVSAIEMEGYESKNFRIESKSGKWVLKIYEYDQLTERQLIAENLVLDKLQEADRTKYPIVILNTQGKGLTICKETHKIYRLLSFIEGRFLAESTVDDSLLKSFGQFLAIMDRDLREWSPIEYRAKKIIWDLDHFLMNESLVDHVDDPRRRKYVEYYILQYKENILPHIYQLRKSLIHNDANDWNILTIDNRVSGIIDFGDMVYSSTINELAIGLAYILMQSSNIIHDACQVVRAYNDVYRLESIELDMLPYLIGARLSSSVCNSALTKKLKPDNSYITVSEDGAWGLLERLIAISPKLFSDSLKETCNLLPEKNTSLESLLSLRNKYISSSLSLSYDDPIHMNKAAFQYMYDNEGNSFLDAYNNIIQVGHCHPRVVRAGQKALSQLNTNTRYLYDSLISYSEKLLGLFPKHLDKVIFVNSGSAASDLAIRMAMAYTQKEKIAVVQHGYHGNTKLGIDLSHYKYNNIGGQGRKEFIIEAVLPDTYRGKYRDKNNAGGQYASDFMRSLGDELDIAAFMAEPIVGCGGQVPLASGYLSKIYPEIRKRGGVCISDEVQVGFGRLGSHFWGFEWHGVIPDIVILGKPMGNGHPMAAVVCSSEIADSFNNGMEFFSSFGGNPVSCSIGEAVLDVIKEEKLQENAFEVGRHMMNQFNTLADDFQCIGDVRGSGLFIGIDIVNDRITRSSDRALASTIKNQLRQRYILVSTDGPDDNVIKIKPPLCFTKQNADHLIDEFKAILSNY